MRWSQWNGVKGIETLKSIVSVNEILNKLVARVKYCKSNYLIENDANST